MSQTTPPKTVTTGEAWFCFFVGLFIAFVVTFILVEAFSGTNAMNVQNYLNARHPQEGCVLWKIFEKDGVDVGALPKGCSL